MTINAAAVNGNLAGNGISVVTGSGPNTISAAVALGASQSWTVASATSLAVSGDVSGTGFALTLPGAGTVILSGNNGYDGGTNLNAGKLIANSTTAIGTGPLTVINAAIDNTTASPITLSTNNTQTWVNNGALAFTGTRSLDLGTGAVTLGDSATANFTLTSNAATATSVLTVGGAITGGAGGTAGNKTLTVAGTGDIVLSGSITKGATATSLDLTVTNTGNVSLGGTSTIRTLNANGGATSVIDLGNGVLTLSNTGAQTINSTGGTINASGSGSIVLSGTTASPGDNGVATGATLTINAPMTGNTDFEFYSLSQFGTFVFTNVNNSFNNIQFNANGAVSVPSLGNNGSNGPAGKGSISFGSGGRLIYTGTGETSNKSINQNGTTAGATLDQSGPSGNLKLTTFGAPGAGIKTLTLQGSTAGTGEISAAIINNSGTNTTGVTKAGTGLWNLSGANLYTGTTTISAGTLQLGSATALGGAGPLTMNGTGMLDLFGNSATVSVFTSVTGNTITNTSSATTASTATAPGTPSGAGVYVDRLTITTAGPTAAALITDGPTRKTQIVLNNGLASNATTNTANTYSGGLVLAHNATGTRLTPGTITGTPWGSGPIIIGQATSDRVGLYFAVANQTLANPLVFNSLEGNDVVGAARVDVATTFTGTQTAGLSAISYSSYSSAGVMTVSGKLTGSGTFTGTIRAGGLGGGTVISNVAGLVIGASTNNTTTVTLSNPSSNNDYTGDTFVTGKGVLRLGIADQIPNGTGTGNVVVATSGVLNLNAFSETINGLSGAGAVDGTSGTPTLTLGDNNATGNNFSGIIRNAAGTLAVTKIGTGTQILSGPNTYTGGTTLNQGTLTVGVGGTLGAATGALVVNNTNTGAGTDAILNLTTADSTTTGSLSGTIATPSGGVNTATINTQTGRTFTVNQTVDGTYAGSIAGFGGFTLGASSTNTLTLTGANTYTGATTVSAGTLALVGGSQASPITVSTGASLSFTLGSPTTSTSTFNVTAGTIKITGTPTLSRYTLISASTGITGTPTLNAAIPGYVLQKYGNTLVLETVALNLYQAWADTTYSPALTDKLPGDDQDGDTFVNLMEYGFGTHPTVSSAGSIVWVAGGAVTTAGQPVAVNFANPGVDYRAVFGRRKDYVAAGLTYTVEFSADMSVWVSSATTPTVLTGAGGLNPSEIEAVSVPYPLLIDVGGNNFKKPTFFRVAISN